MPKVIEVTNQRFGHKLTLRIGGDEGGNGQENALYLTGDQFSNEEGGFTEIRFFGAWELDSFFDLVAKAKEALESGNYTDDVPIGEGRD